MGKESEVIILDVDRKEVARRLRELRAKRTGTYAFRRMEFLLKGSVKGAHSWGRVRTDGKKTTITLKEMQGKGGFTPMNEYEVGVDDFEEAMRIMDRLVRPKLATYFENTREAYSLGKAQVTIDKWPEIPAFMEIEAPTMGEVKRAYGLLGIKGRLVGNSPIHKIYGMYGLEFEEVMSKNGPELRRILKG